MRPPFSPSSPIDAARYQGWISDFGSYRYQVTESRILSWLNQFKAEDRDIAARVLDAVDYIGQDRIIALYKAAINVLPGWDRRPSHRRGRWRFAAMSGSAGESGDRMLHDFRLANGLDNRRFDEMFIYRRDIVGEKLGPEDTLVLVDDFSGSGRQICTAWEEVFAELVPNDTQAYLVLLAAGSAALTRIRHETLLIPYAGVELGDAHMLFEAKCRHFTTAEKQKILEYCAKVYPSKPKGEGDCGYLLVFAHRCPNNTIPILWHHSPPAWWAVFPRN